jgi:hypothetical protein
VAQGLQSVHHWPCHLPDTHGMCIEYTTIKYPANNTIIYNVFVLQIFILAIKESIGPPIIALPLPFITLGIAMATRSKYTRPMASLSLLLAEDRDNEDSEGADEMMAENKDLYLNPVFRFDQEDHDAIISQCKVLRDVQAREEWPPAGQDETITQLIDTSDEDASLQVSAAGKKMQQDEDFHDVENQ